MGSPAVGLISSNEAALALSRCMTTENAEYCMLINEWAWLIKIASLLINARSAIEFSFGVRAWTEMEIWCVKCMLKVVSREKNLGLKG